MSTKLSAGQKAAILAIKTASARLIDDVKKSAWAAKSADFEAKFHLTCTCYDTGWSMGQDGQRHPAQVSITLFEPVWTKVN